MLTPHWTKRGIAIVKKKISFRKKAVQAVEKEKKEKIVDDLKKLGLRKGDVVLVHSALSAIGVVEGGANAVIDALVECVGSEGTLLMPSFNRPIEVFDVRKTPCNTGAVPSAFLNRPGVVRSLHPTHSIAGLGLKAKEILRGHEKSPTSFDDDTPYDYLVKHNGKILLVGNNNNTLVHYIELKIGFPNTHAAEQTQVKIVDYEGKEKSVSVKKHTLGERLVIVEDSTPEKRDFVLFQDYLVIPFEERRKEIQAIGFLQKESEFLSSRQKQLERDGTLSFGNVGKAASCLIECKPFAERMIRDLKTNLAKHASEYKEMASASVNWNETQWYFMVWKNKLLLKALKTYRRTFNIR